MTSPPGEPSRRSQSDSFDHGRFSPGTILAERYRIVGRLGVGGMGEVYRADDLKIGQAVALKFLPEAFEHDRDRLEKLMVELRTARQVSHPNVCRVYDVGDVDGRRFLTMEYVDGEDLRGLLKRIGRLPEDKGLEIARQICAGLAAIHDRGVLHRDLKPANIMLDGRGRVRLTDFGLATATTGAGTDGEIAGTPAYMAPEQLGGRPLSPATDLYSLGLVLFELFTGERVHKGDRLADAREGRAGATTTTTLTTSGSGSKVDPIVLRVIERCLDADPARRPQSAIIVSAALPGGDPLAAALAAGETPSPQMVAAAGSEGGLPFVAAVPLLVASIAGMVALAWLVGRGSYPTKVTFPNSPEVLESKAREMLGRLGYTGTAVDSASGFVSIDDYEQWLKTHDTTAARWQHVASVRPPMVRFWYRSSPQALEPQDFFAGNPGGGVQVRRDDPAMTLGGMAKIELDPKGALVALDAVADERLDPASTMAPPDWPALFREAGLDINAFTPATPEWTSRTGSDVTAAWSGPGADDTGAPLRVEAAALRGRPVFFRLVGPWTRPSDAPSSNEPPTAILVFILTLMAGVLLSAFVLSLRNVRLGKADTQGAIRLATAVGVLMFVAQSLGSSVPRGEAWVDRPFALGSWAACVALLVWALYVALEPYARRHWPRMLISWSRLLDGRWRDPLIGRDLLVGSVIGVAMGFVSRLRAPADVWSGQPPALDVPSLALWMGARFAAAGWLNQASTAILVALGVVMLLVMFRLILRGERAAAIGALMLLAITNALDPTNRLVAFAFGLVVFGTLVFVATRFGLVMVAAFLISGPNLGAGFATPGFALGGVVAVMALKIALGVFGFFTATRGRKASAWLDG